VAVVFKNNAKTTLSAGITASATSITVSDGSVFPSLSGGDVFFLTLDDGTNNEIVKCTAISTNTLTVVRAQESTTARTFSSGDEAQLRLTAGILGLFSQTGAAVTDEIEAYLDANGLTFPDNVKGQFGSSNDLQIYHDGSNSYIKDTGTGNLRVDATNFYVRNSAGTELKIGAIDDGAVDLYHNGSKKLATTSTGIDVTGSVTASDDFIGDTFGTSTNKITWSIANTARIFTNGAERLRVDSSGNVGIGTSSPSRQLTVQNSGNAIAAIVSGTSSLAQLALGDTADDNYAQIILENSTNKLQIQNGGGGAVGNRGITLDSSENVGIGTESPSEKLHVIGNILTSGGVKVGDSSADALHFFGILKQGSGSGTTVMDSSRNLTNIGTISSGAITSSGAMTINEGNAFTDLNVKSDRTSGNIGGVNFVNASNVIKGQVFGNTDGTVYFYSGGQTEALRLDFPQTSERDDGCLV
jgi:hypothetical protein